MEISILNLIKFRYVLINMTEFLFLSLARPTRNRLKWNTDGMIKTGPLQGEIMFISILGHLAPQLIQVKMFMQTLILFEVFISNPHISFHILDIPEILRDNHVTNAIQGAAPNKMTFKRIWW